MNFDLRDLTRAGWVLLVATVIITLVGGTAVLATVGQAFHKASKLGMLLSLPVLALGFLFFVIGSKVLAAHGILVVRLVEEPQGFEAEASMNCDAENVELFLRRIAPLLSAGFGESGIRAVVQGMAGMAVDDESEFEFMVEFDSHEIPLRVRLFMDDIESPDLYFFTSPSLAERIGEEMMMFAEELGN